jgi:O-antigen/teichoic acid export membrane protein
LSTIGRPPLAVQPGLWRAFLVNTVPYAAQDAFSGLLARIDTVILSLLAAEAAVGRYGAAYRLFEATFFVSWSLNTAFAAMYTYLRRDTEPSIHGVFQRSVKLALAALVPCAVTMAVLAEPVTRVLFGEELESAAGSLRLLAPAVLLAGVMYLSSSLIVSRRSATIMVAVTAGMVAVNVALNLLLIPRYADQGAAAAMLATELLVVPITLAIAARTVGGLRWGSMLAGPTGAGIAMVGAMVLLAGWPIAALAAGLAVYLGVLVALERLIDPTDLRFVAAMLGGRLQARLAR